MKTKLILGSLLASTLCVMNAQNTFPTPSGNAGIGLNFPYSPAYKLDIATSTNNDGIRIVEKSSGLGACGIWLDNQTTGGRNWSLMSLGNGDTPGAGYFTIFQNVNPWTGTHRFLIDKMGRIGIGVSSIPDTLAKLQVLNDVTPPGQGTYYKGVKAIIQNNSLIPNGWAWHMINAIHGEAAGQNAEAYTTGVFGEGKNAQINYGGRFTGSGGNYTSVNYGLQATAITSGVNTNFGIYAEAANGQQNYAGYFAGNVYRSGWDNFSSDRKLKEDIKPLVNAMDKIKLLKPRTYSFRHDPAFKNMNLPEGIQMGLIAQELEEVFPELVAEIPAVRQENGKGEVIEKIPAHKAVRYVNLIPVMISAIQEQQEQITEQVNSRSQLLDRVNALEKELVKQQQLNSELSKKISAMTGTNDLTDGLSGNQMSQNEPNPFTHETLVKYTLSPGVNEAYMVIYDLTGKQVKRLLLENSSSSITITANELQPGIYIYSIIADGRLTDSKRMIVAEK